MAKQSRTDEGAGPFPRIRPMGLTGLLVQFSERLDDAPNRAALGFQARMIRAELPGVEEISPSLGGVFLRLDPLRADRAAIESGIEAILAEGNRGGARPEGGRRWTIPAAFAGPDLDAVAEQLGKAGGEVAGELAAWPLRVMALGFAPGLPYMGILPEHWDIPRKAGLTPRVPAGGIVVAVRQAIIFPTDTPTGWWHVGQTGFRGFRPAAEEPFLLRPGDEVRFRAVSPRQLEELVRGDPEGGGATVEALAGTGR